MKIYFAKLEGYSSKYYVKNKEIKEYYIGGLELDSNSTIESETCESFITQLKEMKENITVYFHNGSNYDFHFLLPTLTNMFGDKLEYFIDENKKILFIKIKLRTSKKKYTITLKDSFRIWPLSFDMMSKVVNREVLEYGNYDFTTKFNSIDEFKQYNDGMNYKKNVSDLETLKQFAIQTKEIIDIRDYKLTLPSTAHSKWVGTNKSYENSKFWITDYEEWKIVKKTFKGGYVWNNPLYKDKLIEKVYSYDTISMYPSIMLNEKLPYGEVSYEDLETHTYKIYLVEIKKAKAKLFPFIAKPEFEKGSLLDEIYENELENQIIYLNNYELEYFEKMYEGEWTKTFIMNYAEKYDIFEDYIPYWREIKENSEGGIRQLAKLFLNSLSGKFAQKIVSMKTIFENGEYKKVDDNIKKTLSYIPLAEALTSKARLKLFKAIEENIDNFIYTDADSMHLTKEAKGIELSDNEFGKWKLEQVWDRAIFKQPKHYLTEKDGIKYIKGSGLNVNKLNKEQSITFEDYNKEEFIIINGKKSSSIVRGGVIIYEQDYRFKKGKVHYEKA